MIRCTAQSLDDTSKIAICLTNVVQPRDFILLSGPMGAGKTAFAKAFGAAMGSADMITSPTFVLLQSYEARLPIHHADLYRLNGTQELVDLGLVELVEAGGVGLIEWGEGAQDLLRDEYLHVSIEPDLENDNARHFQFESFGESWQPRVRQLQIAINAELGAVR